MPELASNTTPGTLVLHYKGEHMKILHKGRTTTTNDNVVVYIHLGSGHIWVRPEMEFNDIVEWPDGEKRTRFVVEPIQ